MADEPKREYPPMEDGAYFVWGPHDEYFTVKDGMIYWDDGEVWDSAETGEPGMNGSYLRPPGDHEDYSKWTDEHRAEVLAETNARQARYQAEEEEEQKERDDACTVAKAKLTEEEYEDVYAAAFYDGRMNG